MFGDFDISMFVPGLPFDGETLEKKSLGGSESAAIYMAKALAREGARVMLFCNTSEPSVDGEGVRYIPASTWPVYATGTLHDVCIVQRTPQACSQGVNARLTLLWCHDLALGRQEQTFRGAGWNIDKTIVLSRYMLEQYKEVYHLDEDAFFVSRNGVDVSHFKRLRVSAPPRDGKKLMFCARPERGLDVLLRDVMPKLLARDPALRLYIAGYDNEVREWAGFRADCAQLAASLGDRVVSLGPLTKGDLYRHYLSSAVYVYPTPSPVLPNFREISCISAMECQAAGLPMVTTAVGALPETVAAGAGILVDGDPSDSAHREHYAERLVDGVLSLVNDEAAWERASTLGLAHAEQLDWSKVACEWLTEFERLIRAGNDSTERIVRHFWRQSDIVAAKHTVTLRASEPSEARASEQALSRLLLPWTFLEEPSGYRTRRETLAATYDERGHDAAAGEPRFTVLQRWLTERRDRIDAVLDYGCGQGAYALGLARRLPHLRVHGVDVASTAAMATHWAEQFGLADRVTFSAWPGDASDPEHPDSNGRGRPFNCALLQEILQTVPDPWVTLEHVEHQVERGGKIYVSVPFGPWEFAIYRTRPLRSHIWHFDAHDLRDMVGEKPDLEIDSFYAGDNPLTSEPQGWWIISYTVDHRPIGRIDLDRHRWLQRPRQSLSAAILGGPGSEETLHWTLRSIQHIADEIVMADCGMSGEAKRIAAQYDVRMIPGLDPTRDGFELARNAVLDACTCDWCLWIDTDERLVGAPLLGKYLRENAFHAYGIRQHNFACDTTITPDVPVRLFRRRPFQGRKLRFWGAIHEHPELGLNEGVGPAVALDDVHIAHVGYLGEAGRRQRFARNMPLLKLDQERYPDRLLQKFFIMRENVHLIRFSLAQNRGRVDDAVRAKCRETIALYRRHFLGNTCATNCDALPLYSEALEVLGEGFEAAFQIEADKTEAKPNGVQRFRFASTDDLKAELARKANEKASRFDSRWW